MISNYYNYYFKEVYTQQEDVQTRWLYPVHQGHQQSDIVTTQSWFYQQLHCKLQTVTYQSFLVQVCVI